MAQAIDDTILRSQEQQNAAAKEMRERKSRGLMMRRAGAGLYKTGRKIGGRLGEDMAKKGKMLSEAGQLRRDKRLAATLKGKVKEGVTAPARFGAGRLLQMAWWNLIPSWGLTLFYINLHVFLGKVVGNKIFCKLGEEWGVSKAAGVAAGEAGKTASKGIGLVEVMVLLLLDAIALSIIIAAVALIVMIVDFMSAGWWEKGKTLLNLGWGGIKALADLFL